ncbi:glycogen/starch/alpha-glucan phosphorylase [Angelakisella massiliensis]|uniref:glycogen/starch/alpha-glucan phosphorylase n=1 Tax=Angelakisella massiliensis TaxID=1871018 RepID=UPI0024B1488F|nr:glycogen/starch/alpha-glucan phosphorylase [Angelakisella massiliensis]
MDKTFSKEIDRELARLGVSPETAGPKELYTAVSQAAMELLMPRWKEKAAGKRACYFSAEFLLGRVVSANLLNLGLLEEWNDWLRQHHLHPDILEEIEDDALGNGGLGRLAACFLDSAATQGVPLDGYGIRYRYGLFRQKIENGFQREYPDDWLRFGDPWSVRREEESVVISFRDQQVRAVPYDMPVIGYGEKGVVNTLRLWQAEPVEELDLTAFNNQDYDAAYRNRNRAEALSAVLYPNDDTQEGKRLRLKQQYFFSSASLQSILRGYIARRGEDFTHLSEDVAIQLNDTHPTVSIPELLRLLMEEHLLSFEEAFPLVQGVFAYTNHTIMAEALEKWDVELLLSVIPQVYPYIVLLHNRLRRELRGRGITGKEAEPYFILDGTRVHMARMAIYATHSTNGVARIHTDILKERALKEWYALWPERFSNKTNGITQRRWLALCNPELSALITDEIGDGWLTDLDQLEQLVPVLEDGAVVARFQQVKEEKKRQLRDYVAKREGFELREDFLFDVQIKRLHEYKRQLLNAFSILDTYWGLKEGRITGFQPTAYLFGAKAAPGYYRAKGIIKYIGEVARLINSDPEMKDLMQVLFVQNYNVSYAEKLIPSADVSEQISTAGTEASGTSNMKFMLNGAVTLGTLDGANIEIVEQAGAENNYIFGATVEQIQDPGRTDTPEHLCEAQPRLRRVVESLVDGTFDDGGTGMFRELYDSLMKGASWHKPDQYDLLLDFQSYCDARLRANRDYQDRGEFAHKCLVNVAHAGPFSSDRTILQYAKEIWGL